MSRCGTCEHFKLSPAYTPAQKMDRPGKCGYPVQWPVLPECYESRPGVVNWPSAYTVHPHSGTNCKTYEKLEKR